MILGLSKIRRPRNCNTGTSPFSQCCPERPKVHGCWHSTHPTSAVCVCTFNLFPLILNSRSKWRWLSRDLEQVAVAVLCRWPPCVCFGEGVIGSPRPQAVCSQTGTTPRAAGDCLSCTALAVGWEGILRLVCWSACFLLFTDCFLAGRFISCSFVDLFISCFILGWFVGRLACGCLVASSVSYVPVWQVPLSQLPQNLQSSSQAQAVMFLVFRRCRLRISAETPTVDWGAIFVISSLFQPNPGIALQIVPRLLLPHPFWFIVH
jgi:hypothetical protein